MRSIEIDLDVHRAIETGRAGFEESDNQILRRLLGIDSPASQQATQAKLRSPRSSGAYSTMVGSFAIEANSLKELLRRVLLRCEQLRPKFLAELSATPTSRGRHIVAARAEDIYPQTPHLIAYAERLDRNWWFDTNIGRDQVAAYFKVVARLARLPHIPTVNKRSQKTTVTLEDLGL